jgi:hypothetical protein
VSEPLDLPTREGYDLWSQIYDDEDNPLIALETAWITRLLGDVRGLAVADVGCGTERHALAIHQLSDYVIAATRAGFHIDHMRARRRRGAGRAVPPGAEVSGLAAAALAATAPRLNRPSRSRPARRSTRAYGRGASVVVSVARVPRSASVASATGASSGLNDGFRLSACAR